LRRFDPQPGGLTAALGVLASCVLPDRRRQPEALSEKLMILYEGATVINSMQRVEAPVVTATALANPLIKSQLGRADES